MHELIHNRHTMRHMINKIRFVLTTSQCSCLTKCVNLLVILVPLQILFKAPLISAENFRHAITCIQYHLYKVLV